MTDTWLPNMFTEGEVKHRCEAIGIRFDIKTCPIIPLRPITEMGLEIISVLHFVELQSGEWWWISISIFIAKIFMQMTNQSKNIRKYWPHVFAFQVKRGCPSPRHLPLQQSMTAKAAWQLLVNTVCSCLTDGLAQYFLLYVYKLCQKQNFHLERCSSGTGKTLPLNRLSLNFKCHFLSSFQRAASREVREWRIVNLQLRLLHRRAQLHIITPQKPPQKNEKKEEEEEGGLRFLCGYNSSTGQKGELWSKSKAEEEERKKRP